MTKAEEKGLKRVRKAKVTGGMSWHRGWSLWLTETVEEGSEEQEEGTGRGSFSPGLPLELGCKAGRETFPGKLLMDVWPSWWVPAMFGGIFQRPQVVMFVHKPVWYWEVVEPL